MIGEVLLSGTEGFWYKIGWIKLEVIARSSVVVRRRSCRSDATQIVVPLLTSGLALQEIARKEGRSDAGEDSVDQSRRSGKSGYI